MSQGSDVMREAFNRAITDKFTCRRCGCEFQSCAQAIYEAPDRPHGIPSGKVLGWSRAAPPCPSCGSLYSHWNTQPEHLK